MVRDVEANTVEVLRKVNTLLERDTRAREIAAAEKAMKDDAEDMKIPFRTYNDFVRCMETPELLRKFDKFIRLHLPGTSESDFCHYPSRVVEKTFDPALAQHMMKNLPARLVHTALHS